jgi:hypothetical protein
VYSALYVHIFPTNSPQIGHWTLDNAENNATFMQELGDLLEDRGITYDSTDSRIMCFPHIINICVQHVIEKSTDINLIDIDFDDTVLIPQGSSDQNPQTFEKAVARDPIALSRNIVTGIQSSGKRRNCFEDVIKNNIGKPWCKVDDEDIKPKQLLRDVRTCWDSVYQMIRRVWEMRPVCNYHLLSVQ